MDIKNIEEELGIDECLNFISEDEDSTESIRGSSSRSRVDLLKGLDESKIIKDKIFKNYKEMCGELGIPEKRGDSKEKQLKELEIYYFSHKQQGHKIKITKVHNLTDIEKRVRTLKSNYKDYIEELIVDLLFKKLDNGEELSIGLQQLAEELGIVNKNYFICLLNRREYSRLSKISKEIIDDWSSSFQRFLKRAVDEAVANLEGRDVVTQKKCLTVFVMDNETPQSRLGTEQKIVSRIATHEEGQVILKIEKECLLEFNVSNIRRLFRTYGENGYKRYKRSINKKVKENLGIDGYFLSYGLSFSSSMDLDELLASKKIRLTVRSREHYVTKMNEMTVQKVNNNAQNRHIKTKEVLDSEEKVREKDLVRSGKTYVGDCESITDDILNKSKKKDYEKQIQKMRTEEWTTEKEGDDFITYWCGHLVFNKTEGMVETIDGVGGIYAIHNLRNNKRYVGSTRNFSQRLKEHKNLLESKIHHSCKLQCDFDDYYESDFRFEILEVVDNDINNKTLLKLEQRYIEILNVFSWGYNMVQANSSR